MRLKIDLWSINRLLRGFGIVLTVIYEFKRPMGTKPAANKIELRLESARAYDERCKKRFPDDPRKLVIHSSNWPKED